MVFTPPTWVPTLPEVPDTVPMCDFMFDEQYGRAPFATSLDSYTSGVSGKSVRPLEQRDQVNFLARALARELEWNINEGSEYDKVACVFALNTIDLMTLNWAIHRLNGISTPANPAYSVSELRHQLINSRSKALFTVLSLLPTALEAAKGAGVPSDRVYICEMSNDEGPIPAGFKSLAQLIETGESLPELEPIKWARGQGARQTAFICYSSGTSGLPKGVMISHQNIIANTMQLTYSDQNWRGESHKGYRDIVLGVLPMSHIYSLVVICHASTYRGDRVIVLSKFEMQTCLRSIEKYKISILYIVPPIIISMVKNHKLLQTFDLHSVQHIFTGAAPLGGEVSRELSRQFPAWKVRQSYGLTESCSVFCSTNPVDVWLGSSGCLLPGCEAKLIDAEGKEITSYDQPGELLVKTVSLTLGYFQNEKATVDTFIEMPEGRYLRTGDEVMVRKGPSGNDHIWILDRIKELIKVNGMQVAPAELEACLLNHPWVADCAVISVPHETAGEAPKAFVVKSRSAGVEKSDASIRSVIARHVEKEKARYKWLHGGIEFLDVIPKSSSGKILRRVLRDQERKARRIGAATL